MSSDVIYFIFEKFHALALYLTVLAHQFGEIHVFFYSVLFKETSYKIPIF